MKMEASPPTPTDHAGTLPAVTVKVLARMPPEVTARLFSRQLPSTSTLGNCRFVFDVEAAEYDWLVIYHDMHRYHRGSGREPLRCLRKNTILITTEPSSITVYGTDYLRQYGTIITSQEPWAIKHPNAIFTQGGLIWHYGLPFNGDQPRQYEELRVTPPTPKSRLISTVCSSRTGRITDHSLRVKFTGRLKEALPELDIFGHGVRPMNDKAEALDPYRYHIAVENHICPHHLTEKLPDAFLGYTLPFYHGAPNTADYFPPESFIPIDISDFTAARDIILSTIRNNEYGDRLPYIQEARQRVLDESNLFAILERYITERAAKAAGAAAMASGPAGFICNRQVLRIRRPLSGLQSLYEKALIKGRYHLAKTYHNLR